MSDEASVDLATRIVGSLGALRKDSGVSVNTIMVALEHELAEMSVIDTMAGPDASSRDRAQAFLALLHHYLYLGIDDNDIAALGMALNIDVSEDWSAEPDWASPVRHPFPDLNLTARREHGVKAFGKSEATLINWEKSAMGVFAHEVAQIKEPPSTLHWSAPAAGDDPDTSTEASSGHEESDGSTPDAQGRSAALDNRLNEEVQRLRRRSGRIKTLLPWALAALFGVAAVVALATRGSGGDSADDPQPAPTTVVADVQASQVAQTPTTASTNATPAQPTPSPETVEPGPVQLIGLTPMSASDFSAEREDDHFYIASSDALPVLASHQDGCNAQWFEGASVEYNLTDEAAMFSTNVQLSRESGSTGVATVSFLLDDKTTPERIVEVSLFQDAQSVSFRVDGARRLRIHVLFSDCQVGEEYDILYRDATLTRSA